MNFIELPVKTVGLNGREHFHVKAKRIKSDRLAGRMGAKQLKLGMPCVVTLTRLSAGELDFDNLVGSQKGIRDGVADALGVADNDKRIEWRYAQERCARGCHGVRIRVDVVTSVEAAEAMVNV